MSKPSQAYVRLRSKTTGEWFAHPDLRPRLVADANERGVNMTEVAVGILCEEFGVEYEPNGRRTDPKVADDILNISSIPHEVMVQLKQRYERHLDGAREILCRHYGLKPGRPARRLDEAPSPV